MTVSLEGEELGSVELTNEFRDYVFPIPAATASSLARAPGRHVQIRIRKLDMDPADVLADPTSGARRHDRSSRDSVVFEHLQIPYRQERVLVGLADAGLACRASSRLAAGGSRGRASAPRRILLLRLERVGDLVMVLEAIAMVRAMAPDAHDRSRRRQLEPALARLDSRR